ncbi:MAG TPA: hypothetical protein RMH85_35685 [Polyangiaceae bacterium LLY-WYZ-15_(1-7)]|nr:hypothetical protein [Sandaracinus sp.]HJK89342.1 hypothetical protein [Polyangiaceae bacterium LLY-WYZ-15_(1-7)]MBJ71263.1 hypothetical protein [Sandaracinus sp.]HJL05837.1 hypothetical protein [Polyangiaceae bacterium LLY-WYZ-15_(1-7)]HJL13883.1 hypothetical protein [Polyangiaceae bacterium LLY-WYZ-15_(1-7)]
MSSSPAARRAERPRRGLAARLVVGLLGATLLVPLLAPADADAQEGPDSHAFTEDRDRSDEAEARASGEEDRAEDEAPSPPDLAPRAVPDYDGRPAAPPSAGRQLLWIPRILFAPLYFLTEFVLRRPLSALSRMAEQSTSDPLRFFVFGERQQVAIAPTLYIDFGDQPSAGLYLRWNEAGHPSHKMRFYFATWGKDWLRGRVLTRWEPAHERWRFEARFHASRRPDGRFFGIGAESRDEAARYQFRQLDGQLAFEGEPWRATFVTTWAGVREVRFSDDVFAGATIEEQVAQGAYPTPPGYEDGYLIYAQGAEVIFNTRRARPADTSGVLLELRGEHAFDLRDRLARRWFSYGGAAGAYVDLSSSGHVLGVIASASLVEPLAGEVPFTELPDLGGNGPMRGFRNGRLRGQSAASVVAQYSWPVWVYLDAIAHVGFGGVWGERFEDFSWDDLRMSFGIGFGAIHSVDHRFDFTLAWGTEPITAGFQVTSFRLALGATFEFGSAR